MRRGRGLSRKPIRAADRSFFRHRPLVPQPDDIAVGILQLCAIAPEDLAWTMGEGDAAPRPSGKGRVDIVDLEPQRGAVRYRARGVFLEEDREALAVLQR